MADTPKIPLPENGQPGTAAVSNGGAPDNSGMRRSADSVTESDTDTGDRTGTDAGTDADATAAADVNDAGGADARSSPIKASNRRPAGAESVAGDHRSSRPLYTRRQIRAIETAALAAHAAESEKRRARDPGAQAGPGLMQRAGLAAAALATALVTARGTQTGSPSDPAGRILVLAGPGNNGGDALDMAARLSRDGMRVFLVLFAVVPKDDSTAVATLPADALAALAFARADGKVVFCRPDEAAGLLRQPWNLIVDGLFGIGLTRPIENPLRCLIEQLNDRQGTSLACPVLALDTPSGLDTDTGVIANAGAGGEDRQGVAVRASHTLTFIGDKPGLHTGVGRDFAGQVTVAGLEISPDLYPPAQARLSSPELFSTWLRPRRHASHKGSYGDVAVVGGARGMNGATVLSSRAALFCGAGRVLAGFIGGAPAYDAAHPEIMCRDASTLDLETAAIVAGPGMGESDRAAALLEKILATTRPLVLDADALNMLARRPALAQRLRQRADGARDDDNDNDNDDADADADDDDDDEHDAPTILTPHPLEAARLLGLSAAEVQADRPKAARALAGLFGTVVVLKGSGTIVAKPDGEIAVNPTGNAGLATAGSGDVLSGICGALLAQGWPAWPAACAAVWLHGRAADVLVAGGTGPIGLTAGELILPVRRLLNELTAA